MGKTKLDFDKCEIEELRIKHYKSMLEKDCIAEDFIIDDLKIKLLKKAVEKLYDCIDVKTDNDWIECSLNILKGGNIK